MAQYIVTITPIADDDGPGEESSRTTMRIVADDTQVYIKELTVRVAENARLGPSDVLQVDLDLLMQAFAVKRPTAHALRSTPVASRPDDHPAQAPAGPVNEAPPKSDRAYRRMPEPAELKDIYLSNRTIIGVAQHYGVPTHTAQGWISRLRRKGVIPSGS